jgi:hypothetical protein
MKYDDTKIRYCSTMKTKLESYGIVNDYYYYHEVSPNKVNCFKKLYHMLHKFFSTTTPSILLY